MINPSILTLLFLTLVWLTTAQSEQFVAQSPDLDSWWVDSRPNPNDTSNIIFDTVYSLSTTWSSRRYRNGDVYNINDFLSLLKSLVGHTIVPGVLPVGTLLYHGRGDSEIPSIPEWTALESELAMMYCGLSTIDDKGCWLLTLVTERPLRVLYFDGYSGLKLPNGTIDSQDAVVWGEVLPDKVQDEPQRIADLCRWGESFGIDGFVR